MNGMESLILLRDYSSVPYTNYLDVFKHYKIKNRPEVYIFSSVDRVVFRTCFDLCFDSRFPPARNCSMLCFGTHSEAMCLRQMVYK
ncbi:hypothetical protein HYPBUDRAFT_199201 [Hyphopichia burtonii NRRL Y-1933]|uniref:Uncharacterized protein n=1 Tax=Hyphopichia burtonii NRRL Y-1933 TaxID=984485 RepID=A0A1E4RKJ4_9ASCO|nr:hypothetical protein HYPBUDRAFT_199201 [Hyphopichia burtonii NRRL Y-1933]ODV67798.1 hypothetical protein HYPBUDRAFT_199201 [Hyphopichia burtonii NRRL Y-1933]